MSALFGFKWASLIVDSTFALEDAAKAHEHMENSDHFGKIVLKVG